MSELGSSDTSHPCLKNRETLNDPCTQPMQNAPFAFNQRAVYQVQHFYFLLGFIQVFSFPFGFRGRFYLNPEMKSKLLISCLPYL